MLDETQIKMIEEAIWSNPDCSGNILLTRMVFGQEPVEPAQLEFLVLLSNKSFCKTLKTIHGLYS